MSKIKGQNLRIFIGGTVVGKCTSCQISLTNNLEDSSTKDSTGLFNQETIATKSWQVSVDSLDETDIDTLITAFCNRTAFTLKWDQTSGLNNAVAEAADFSRTGTAYLTDATFSFNDRQNITKSLQFTGTGELS